MRRVPGFEVVGIIGVLLGAASAHSAEVELPEVTAVVRRHFPENSKGGLALLVTRKRSIIHCKGYGLRYGKTPITAQSRMPLASISKQFAAMCAVMLIEEGKLSLSDRVSKHLPDIRLQHEGREVLVQDLLWHTSGLPNFINAKEKASIEEYKQRHGLDRLNNRTHADWLTTLPLRRKPGQVFEYTNSGYVMLARIIEVVAKKPFHQFQQERILDVLSMTSTTDSTRFNGSGNMSTSLVDYARWDRALWDGTLLGEKAHRMLLTPGTLDNGEPVNYGFGWNLQTDVHGVTHIWHGGAGSPKSSARNMVKRDLRNQITVALFVRENLRFNKAYRLKVVDEIHDTVKQLKRPQN